jgi:DNA invertase Pin-like site-specific DNA recombinase
MNAEILHITPTTEHRAKMAYVYIRQSSLMQVTRHAESTDLQYSLVERAVALWWPRERVELVDEDLGKSGAQAEARGGFQRLLSEVSLARVGLVLSFDASRLARTNRDWYQRLEVCTIFGTLIADGERLYDPRLYHDRLLLGLSGMMSEAELHHLKQPMDAGARHEASGENSARACRGVSSSSHRRSHLEARRRSAGAHPAGGRRNSGISAQSAE